MINLILKSYLSIFLSVGLASIAVLLIGIYWILRGYSRPSNLTADISPIAGDDVLSTQLDLARAYIETNNKHLAKPILSLVLEQGSQAQISEARMLLGLI